MRKAVFTEVSRRLGECRECGPELFTTRFAVVEHTQKQDFLHVDDCGFIEAYSDKKFSIYTYILTPNSLDNFLTHHCRPRSDSKHAQKQHRAGLAHLHLNVPCASFSPNL